MFPAGLVTDIEIVQISFTGSNKSHLVTEIKK